MSKNPNRTAIMEKHLYGKYKDQAKRKNTPFEIGLELFTYLIYQNCHYCDEPPGNIAKDRYEKNHKTYMDNNIFIIYNGIDRKENSLGYVKENVVPCCKYCNSSKLDRNKEEFLKHVTKIYNFTKDKTSE